jgi:ribosomal protein L15E
MDTETLQDKASKLMEVIKVVCEHPIIMNRLKSKIKKLAQNANEKQEQRDNPPEGE